MPKIKLMLVDDHDVVRTGLRTFLQTQEGLEVIAEASSGEAALDLVEQLQPDLVVMDITMSGMDGLEATRRIKAVCSTCKILALTVHTDKEYFFEMLAAGADGYVTKQVAAAELVGAIRVVAVGNVYLQPALATWLLEDYRRLSLSDSSKPAQVDHQSDGKNLEHLSSREIQVLQAVADGMTNIEIGEKLGISHKTVARHRERIMSKLDLHSCAELVKFAVRTGLIKVN
jgi:two-component system, NarL family, response regulator NreC